VLKLAARSIVLLALLLAAACGYEAGATFNGDGSVTISLKFLVPNALTQSPGTSISGISAPDIKKANDELAAKYPGAKVFTVDEGDETGAEETIPFKTEKDAFAFLTQPSQLGKGLNATAGSSLDLGNTGGLFATATHSSDGATDTYTFQTQPQPLSSASPGSQEAKQDEELASLISITFALTVPHEITSAEGALFTADRKTAIWKLSLTAAQTFRATTGAGGSTLTASTITGAGPAVLVGVILVAVGLGFLGGLVLGWSRPHLHAATPAPVPVPVTQASPPSAMAGPPSDLPPPAPPGT
jgi:hypothetical protein